MKGNLLDMSELQLETGVSDEWCWRQIVKTPPVWNFKSRTAAFMSVTRPILGVRSTMLCVLDSSGSCSSSDRCNGYRWRFLYGSMDNNAAC